ncbi:MAG: hypothetical protein NC910_01210 [Candidatus Omnitrophica bacterium]|nr:hypothetical protein [Candidatus Omnitrophota bacterium]
MRRLAFLLAVVAGMTCSSGFGIAAEDAIPFTIADMVGPVNLSDEALWLFVVPDGRDSPVLSIERRQELLAGRLDVRRPNLPVEWRTILTGRELGTSGIADHWHIFAHGAHWIVVSTPAGSFLLKLDPDFRRLGLFRVAPEGDRGSGGVVTNDMFLVAELKGVAVGHFLPGFGHRIYRFGMDGTSGDPIDFGGGLYRHANGASAERVPAGFLVFAPMSLNPLMRSSIRLIRTDENWRPNRVVEAIAEDGMNIVMPSSVTLPSGYRIVHARVRVVGNGENEPGPGHGQRHSDDGMIVRYVLDPNFTVVSRQVIVSHSGNRPHTALFGNLLLTSWDGDGVWLRVDRLSGEVH